MKIEFNNLYTHFILTTLQRQPLIVEKHRVRIEKYITGVVKNNDSYLYSIYANPEHVHLLVSKSPKISEEKLISVVAESSAQQSAAAFSVSKSDVDKVCKYILNQPEHHKKRSFAEECNKFMKFYQKTIDPWKG